MQSRSGGEAADTVDSTCEFYGLDPDPTRPLLHCYSISNLDNTLSADNSVAAKARLAHPPRVLVPTELQQHLVRYSRVSRPAHGIDVRQLLPRTEFSSSQGIAGKRKDGPDIARTSTPT